MTDAATPKRKPIEGRPVLVVIDIQQSAFVEKEVRSIPHMPDYAARVARTRFAIDRARGAGIPIVFIQEIHRADLVDFGRELDGSEGVHCLDNNPETALAREVIDFRDGDYLVQKRRYSAFYGTDLEILLRGLRAETLLLAGGLTDVCVHYTFVDGHQGDYFCRVIEDCVAGSSPQAHEAALRAPAPGGPWTKCWRRWTAIAGAGRPERTGRLPEPDGGGRPWPRLCSWRR